MAVDVALILKMAPLASQQLKRYRRSNLSKSLDRRVQAELEADPTLSPRVTEAVLNEWYFVHNDPRGAVIIAGLLRDGDLSYLEALRKRTGELLAGLETLPIDVADVVERIVQAVANNFVAAQKDEMNAAQTGTSALLSAIEPLATREDVGDAIAGLAQMLTPPPPRVLLLAGSFDDAQQRHLRELITNAPEAAGALGEMLATRGLSGARELVRAPAGWAGEQPAAFWLATARILADADQLSDAALAYAREAERPDASDRVRALIDAAVCSEADGPREGNKEADRYLAAATAIDPDHPMVRLFVANRCEDPEERLRLTDAVAVRTDREGARKQAQRALTLLALQRYQEAHEAAEASIALAPHGGGHEIDTLATIIEAHSRLPSRAADDRPLMEAVAYQLSLFGRAADGGRTAMAGLAGARAALGTAVLGDQAAALELIDRIATDAELIANPETRPLLIEASLTAQDPARAKGLLEESDNSPESRLTRATIAVMAGEERTQVAAELDALIAELEPGQLRNQATVMRLLAADDPAVKFDPSIVSGVDDAERLVAHTLAAREAALDHFGAARAAVARFDDPASLSIRVDIAEKDSQLPEAIGLQATLARREPTAANLLRLAGLRGRAGDFRGAIRDAMRIATDERKFRSARDYAYGLAAQAALDGDEFEELEDITERWAELSPERQDPLWAHVIALARQNRHPEGLKFALDAGLTPTTEGDRHKLWAELLMYGAQSGPSRMRGLMELSDQFGRPVELERAFIGAVLKTPPSDRGDDDPEVIGRFQEALSTFEERFPDAGGLQKITIDPDEDPNVLVAKLAELQPRDSQAQIDARQDAVDGFCQGRTPAAFVAAMMGRGTAEVLVRNAAHPLAVFDRPTAEAEVAAAGHALDRADASWDETACVTVAQLPTYLAKRIESLLPGSHVGQAVRTALADAVKLQMGGEQVAVMQIMPDGTPRFIEESPDTVKKVRDIQAGADAVAARLTLSPDKTDGADPQLADLIVRDDGHSPFAALASAFLTARRHGIPVFSDDRVVRAYARGIGLPAFGSIALVDAACRRGLIDANAAQEVMKGVLDLGVWGAALEPAAYVDVARRGQFELARCGRALLADEAVLHVDPRLLHNARLLAAIAEEAPEQLNDWAKAIITSYVELLKLDAALTASLLVAAQLKPEVREVSEAIRKRNVVVISALRSAAAYEPTRPDTDPLAAGIVRWLHVTNNAEERELTLENLLAQVDPGEAEDLRARLA